MSRPGTPLPRALMQQPPSPVMRGPTVVERHEPYTIDDCPHSIRNVVSHASLRPSTSRYVNRSSSSDDRYHDDEDYVVMRSNSHVYASEDDRESRARIRSGSRGRRRSRSYDRSSIGDGMLRHLSHEIH